MVVLHVMDIPTLSQWLENNLNKVGMPRRCWSHVYASEYRQIKLALKRKTINEVAIKFNRSYQTINKIAKETI